MNQSREQRRNLHRQGYSGMMNGVTPTFIPINPFEKKEEKKEEVKKQPKQIRNKVRPISEDQVAQAHDNWYQRQAIEHQRTMNRYHSFGMNTIRGTIDLPKRNTNPEKGIVVTNQTDGYRISFPIEDENIPWESTSACYIHKNPFGNCQVFCLARFDAISKYKGKSIKVIETIRTSVYKKQMIFDFRTDDENNMKLFKEMVKKYNLMWQNDYVNGTGAPMRTAMILLKEPEKKSLRERITDIF